MGEPKLELLEGGMAPPAIQPTPKGLEYKRFMRAVRNQLRGMTAESQRRAKAHNIDFIRGLNSPQYRASYEEDLVKAITPGSVHIDRLLTTISVKYQNDEFIGERLMPAVLVSNRSNKFSVYPKRERMGYPDDRIGYRASSNELDSTRTTDNYSLADYGYKKYLDLEVIQNQDAPLNEMADLVEHINNGIAFRREKRILAIVSNSANYAGNTANCTTNWNDTTAPAGGTVTADMLAAAAAMWSGMSPTKKVGFTSLAVWNAGVANNPSLRELFKYTQAGLTSTQIFANYFGLDDILISRAREDTANIGQTAVYARMLLGDVFGVLSVSENPTLNTVHFGSTFREQGDPFTTEWTDPSIGKRGGIYARVAVSEDHKIVAGDSGFLITSLLT